MLKYKQGITRHSRDNSFTAAETYTKHTTQSNECYPGSEFPIANFSVDHIYGWLALMTNSHTHTHIHTFPIQIYSTCVQNAVELYLKGISSFISEL